MVRLNFDENALIVEHGKCGRDGCAGAPVCNRLCVAKLVDGSRMEQRQRLPEGFIERHPVETAVYAKPIKNRRLCGHTVPAANKNGFFTL